MAGYIRQSTYTDGDTIQASDSNDEFDALVAAFSAASGHKHDGTAAEGLYVPLIGDADAKNKVVANTVDNTIDVYVEVGGSAVQQIEVADGAILPVTDNDIDLGSATYEFKDVYIDGTAYLDAVDIDGGTIDGTAVNATTLSASGVTNLDAGTVAAPGLILESETGTGLYRIGANNHGYAVSGAKVLDISSTGLGVTGSVTTTGNLGVGTASPSTWGKTAIQGTTGSVQLALVPTTQASNAITSTLYLVGDPGNANRGCTISNHNAGLNSNNLVFSTGVSDAITERMRLDASGNLHVPGGGGIATNEAFGTGALVSNTTGYYNAASGVNALYSNTTGSYNTASGLSALYGNTEGNYNTASGVSALSNNTTGSSNTALGSQYTTAGAYAPAFDCTTENNRVSIAHTGVTNAYINVAWTVVSDERDKTDFAPIPLGLAFINKLNPTSYRRKISRDDPTPDGPVRYGFKAQDVLVEEGTNPVIVDNEDPDRLRLVDSNLLAVLVKAVQELSTKNDALEARLTAAGL
jgi:hypothetical protein